jgi:lysophospholipase L1-like esterase
MARPLHTPWREAIAAIGLTAGLLGAVAHGQEAQPLTPLSKECRAGTDAIGSESPLPNVAAALRQRRTIRILAIGASASGRGRQRGAYTAVIEELLERAIKGLDVIIINRGVSGELAAQAATRLKTEVALAEPDLVLWQVGTNDALAYVPIDEIAETVTDTVAWLKEHKADVVLVGLQYADRMARDDHYRAVQNRLREVAAKNHVIIIRYGEAMRMVMDAANAGFTPDEFDQTEAGYTCLAQYVARAITLGLYGHGLRRPQSDANPK